MMAQPFKARMTYVPRHPPVSPKRVKPMLIDNENHYYSTPNTDEISPKFVSSPWPTPKSTHSRKTTDNAEPEKQMIPDAIVPTTTNSNTVVAPTKTCWQNLTVKQKLGVRIALIAAVVVSIATVAIVPPVMILVVNKDKIESSFTNWTASVCASGSCIKHETPYQTSMVTVLYPFDSNFNDMTGYATGIAFGSPVPGFTTGSNNYVGSHALILAAGLQQYVQIPYVNLTYRSFTIEAWLYLTGPLLADYGIFGQCDSSGNCMSISVRNGRFALSFDSMNPNNNTLFGTTLTTTADWHHLAVVYDAVLYQQQIYVDGLIDAVSHGMVSPFTVTSSSVVTTIGRTLSSPYPSSFFTGRIDHFTISAGSARSSCQIYNDASLTAYFPFDTVSTWNDYSVNLFNGISGSITTISNGRVGQAISFSSSTSYFQSECFPSIETNDPPFTFALWVNPSNPTNGGTIIHASNLQNGNGSGCYDILALTPSGALVAQVMQTTTVIYATQGPIIPANTWTHVAILYSPNNGVRIFVDGQLSAVSASVSTLGTQDFTDPQFITLGNNSPLGPAITITCRSGTIPYTSGSFIGAIDDFRLYNRELTNQELCVLTNM